MAKFRRRPLVIEATQWFKNGDHPEDRCLERSDPMTGQRVKNEGRIVRYFRHPGESGTAKCTRCGELNNRHGWIDKADGIQAHGYKVCPGSWIVRGGFGDYYPVRDSEFKAEYEAVDQVID